MKETDTDNKPVRFDFFNKNQTSYYIKYKNIFDMLTDFQKHNLVTLNGKKTDPKIIWG